MPCCLSLLVKTKIKKKMSSKTKRQFTNTTRMPYQDVIALLIRAIDFHNKEAMQDFINTEFHHKQAMNLKLYLIDLKEFIAKKENESLQN